MKIDKEFTLSDSTVNSYGFRLLTSGYQMPEFQKNPIGYYMHQRDSGVVLKWTDLRIDGDKIMGKPDINMGNARGQLTFDEVNNGFLNAASVGSIVVLETSDDEALKMAGQTGLTVTKWFNRECSLVDVPGNFNAISLQDKDGNKLTLQDLKAGIVSKMADTTADDRQKLIDKAIADKDVSDLEANSLKKLVNNPDFFTQALAMFKQQRIDFLNSHTYDDLEEKGLAEEIKTKDFASYKAKYEAKFGKAYDGKEPVQEGNTSLTHLRSLSYDELDRKGLAERLLNLDAACFNEKFKARFGRDYTNLSASPATNAMQPKKANTNPRLTYLQSLDWDELDNNNGFLEELKNLDEQSFNDKFKAKFGKDWKPQQSQAVDKTKSALAEQEEAKKRLTYLQSLSFDELDNKGCLAELKAADNDSYNAKFKARFGKNPNK